MLHCNRENQRVRRDITAALLELMEQKPFALITVTELIQKAKVARASYYRNYASKEDIIRQLLQEMVTYFTSTADYDLHNYQSCENILHTLDCMRHFQSELRCLFHSGFSNLCLETLNHYLETAAGDMPQRSITRYELYFFSGALFNVAINWLSTPSPEPAAEVARSLSRALSAGNVPE